MPLVATWRRHRFLRRRRQHARAYLLALGAELVGHDEPLVRS